MRRKLDFYPTKHNWIVKALLGEYPSIKGTILEPCAGDNDITRVLQSKNFKVITNDIDMSRQTDYHLDATKKQLYETVEYDWVITNPPFNCAIDVLERAYEKAKVGIAFYLRKTITEPTKKREKWLDAHPITQTLTLKRYSFTQNGKTDSVSCDWFIWDKTNKQIGTKVIPRKKYQ